MKKLQHLFLLLFCLLNIGANAQCPNSLSGFSLIGEYDNSKYFLSDNPTQWQTAQANAASNGGNLVAINSQAENDFLLVNINEIVFIGYNDAASEGNFAWSNSDPVTFNNLSETNTSNKDFANMNFWNGSWGLDNQFVSRRYLVEIPCSGVGTGITTTCPNSVFVIAPHGGDYSAFVDWVLPTATTDCPLGGLTITQTNGPSPGGFYPPTPAPNGIIVAYQFADACGNTALCLFEMNVIPEPTEMNCPNDIVVDATSSTGAIVNYADPIILSYCSPDMINLVSGLPSGSEFPIGTTTVELSSFMNGQPFTCQNTVSCSFNVTVNSPGGGGGCPDDISGFTTIGEFGNSKYYISNSIARPTDAQAEAETNGGYLAVISSQAENDFVQQGADGLTYIGLNDQNTEGNLEWFNGEPLTYNNIDPCGFCNENSADQDFGVIQPWDGGWSFSNFWNQRKYIMEIPCESGGGNDEPDLTVSNLNNLTSFGNVGEVVSFNFDLNNIGVVTATGSYNINTYISTDNIFSVDDALVGEVPTGDTPAGTIQNVPAAITVPNLPIGNYFLIVVADALNQITESNENNNNAFTSFEIVSDSSSEGCAYYKNYPVSTSGVFRDFEYQQSSTGLTLTTNTKIETGGNTEWVFETTNINPEGNASGATTVTLPTFQKSKFGDYGYETVENTLTQFEISALQSDGSTLWSTTINLTTSDPDIDQLLFTNQLEVSDHIIVYGIYHFGMSAKWRPFMIKLDMNGNEVWQSLLPTLTNFPTKYLLKEEAIGGGYYFNANIDNVESIIKVDEFGNQVWTNGMAGDLVSNNVIYGGQAPDGSGIFYGVYSVSNNRADITKVDPITGDDIWQTNLTTFATTFDVGQFIGGIVPTSEGGVVADVRLFNFFPFNSDNFYGKLDANGNVVWSHTMPTATGFGYIPVFETEDKGYIFGKYEVGDNSVDVFKVNSDGTLDPLCDDIGCPTAIAGFTYLGEFAGSSYFLSNDVARPTDAQTIANQNGGYLAVINSDLENGFLNSNVNELVYIGLNDFDTEGSPQWVNGDPLNYTNFDICSFCEGNSDDMDFVVMHGWNGGWSWSNFYNQRAYVIEIPCTNSNALTDPNIGNSLIAIPQQVEDDLKIKKIHPNPAMNEIFTFINSNIEQEVDIQIFDARGTMIKSVNVMLYKGDNSTRISIADLPGGFYSIYIPQINSKMGMKRFVKVRD